MDWLEALVKAGAANAPGLLDAIESALPLETLVLRERAVDVTQMLLERLKPALGGEEQEAAARLLNNLSVRLSGLGRREDALGFHRRAVEAGLWVRAHAYHEGHSTVLTKLGLLADERIVDFMVDRFRSLLQG